MTQKTSLLLLQIYQWTS